MEFIETPVFTRTLTELLSDEEYRHLQTLLRLDPAVGAVVAGTGGIRKVRWAQGGRGKRGGVRIIYYHAASRGAILMLLIYPKNEQATLSPAQKSALRGAVQRAFG
jgi:mRNA-degrading endonuclease RelE of RelBE toxin-antitoxin system